LVRLNVLKASGVGPRRRPYLDPINPPVGITVYLSTPERVQRFVSHADACGLTRGSAGASLIMAELDERWLDRAISLP
jgi:hypothetical protein